jgi:hypothetical protein
MPNAKYQVLPLRFIQGPTWKIKPTLGLIENRFNKHFYLQSNTVDYE